MSVAREVYDALTDRFGPDVATGLNEAAVDPWVEVPPERVTEIGLFLRDDPRFRFEHLNDLCVVDYFEPDPAKAARAGFEPHLEVVYHLSNYETRKACVLKAKLPRWRGGAEGELPTIPTVSSVWPIADWHEREAYDLMGVRFEGHPNLVRMLMPEDWQGHPLRKDYEWPDEYHGIRAQ